MEEGVGGGESGRVREISSSRCDCRGMGRRGSGSPGMGQNGVRSDQHSGTGRRRVMSHTQSLTTAQEGKLTLGWCGLLATQKVEALCSSHGRTAAKRLGTAALHSLQALIQPWDAVILIPINHSHYSNPLQNTLRSPQVLWTQVRGSSQEQKTPWESERLAVQRAFFPNFWVKGTLDPALQTATCQLIWGKY